MRVRGITPILVTVVLALSSSAVAVASTYAPAEFAPLAKPTCIRSATPIPNPCGPPLKLEIDLAGKLRPRALSRRDLTPIAFSLGGKIFTSSGTATPGLREIEVSIDKHIAVDAANLPACGRRQLVRSGVAAARRACRESMVGAGVAHVAIGSGDRSRSRLLLSVFNGGLRDGKMTLLIHSSLSGPTPTRLIASVKLEKTKGRYGLVGVLRMPSVLGEVALHDFHLEVKRFLKYKGTQRHFALARCFDDRLQVRLWFKFVDGASSSPTLLQPCVTRG
jgi:hypothetical protein